LDILRCLAFCNIDSKSNKTILSETFTSHKEFYFVTSNLKSIGHENPDNNLESLCVISVFKSRRVRWARHLESIYDKRNAYKTFADRSEGKKTFVSLRCTWEDNVKKILNSVCRYGLDRLRSRHLSMPEPVSKSGIERGRGMDYSLVWTGYGCLEVTTTG
jgi:hypothetical protein